MKRYTYIIIYKDHEDCDGQRGDLPIAIFCGSEEEAVSNIIRIIAKWLAHGDFSLIIRNETLIAKSRKSIEEIMTKEDGGEISIDGRSIGIYPVSFFKDMDLDECGNRLFMVRDIIIDESRGKYIAILNKPCNKHVYVDLVTEDAFDSPFLYPSPFILRASDVFAVDPDTGQYTGPYIRIEEFRFFFVVHTKEKVGVLYSDGEVLLDCIYDGVYPERRHIVLEKDGKMGLYSFFGHVLIPCEYDNFKFSEDLQDPVIAIKGTQKGYIDIDGTFYPVDEETEDFGELDPTLDYI